MQALAGYVADLDVSEDQPWMLQQLLQGSEYSSYSIAHEGHVVLHSDTEARASNLRYLDTNSREVRCHEQFTYLMQSACMSPSAFRLHLLATMLTVRWGGTYDTCASPDACMAFLPQKCAFLNARPCIAGVYCADLGVGQRLLREDQGERAAVL